MSRGLIRLKSGLSVLAVSSSLVAADVPAPTAGSEQLLQALAAFDQKRPRDFKIVGGADTSIKKHPWQVALLAARIPENSAAQFCGGSIVAPQWILTAAHCVDQGTRPDQIEILSGTASLATGGTRTPVATIVIHEKWNPVTHDFDIALVRVTGTLVGSEIGGPAINRPDPKDGDPVTVTGWGALAWGSPAGTKTLQEVQVPFVSRTTCNKPASYGGSISENMICAGKTGADSCQGDSGGPATVGTPRVLVGIVSWGESCAAPKKFGVYTRLSRFTTWVREKSDGAVKW